MPIRSKCLSPDETYQRLLSEGIHVFASWLADTSEDGLLLVGMFTMMDIYKACLASRDWNKVFGHPQLHSMLDSRHLTRAQFLRELRRPLLMLRTLRIGSRIDWKCAREHLRKIQSGYRTRVDLTKQSAHPIRPWWQKAPSDVWARFEGDLFSALHDLGCKGSLVHLTTLDLGFSSLQEPRLENPCYWGIRAKPPACLKDENLLVLSTYCPRLMHLRVPSIVAGLSDVLFLWTSLRSFSSHSSGDWKAPATAPGRVDAAAPVGGSSAQECVGRISFETLERLTLTNGDPLRSNGASILSCYPAYPACPADLELPRPGLCWEDFLHAPSSKALQMQAPGGHGLQLRRWIERGCVFSNLRRLHLHDISGLEMLSQERFPFLEELSVVALLLCKSGSELCVHLPLLRKFSLSLPGKNTNHLKSLSTQRLRLFVFNGGETDHYHYSPVCCQIARGLLQPEVQLSSLKAFRFQVSGLGLKLEHTHGCRICLSPCCAS